MPTRPGKIVFPARLMTLVSRLRPYRHDLSVLNKNHLVLLRRRTRAVDHTHILERQNWRIFLDVGLE
jgi:hypothetical protein